LDDEDVDKFRQDLTRLGAVLMPFARAILCLESKDTTPANVYLYWLAVVAQLNDLIVKDDNAGLKSKYKTTVKELIRSIANFRFAQLIEEEQSSNVYFTAFVLDPGTYLSPGNILSLYLKHFPDNRGASILATPNPLAVKPATISFRGGEPAVKPQRPLVERIGLSLMRILQMEYGNEYRPDRTVEGKNCHGGNQSLYCTARPNRRASGLKNPTEGVFEQRRSLRPQKKTESPRDWWVNLLNHDDSDILAVSVSFKCLAYAYLIIMFS
jgi:hypothetical protein